MSEYIFVNCGDSGEHLIGHPANWSQRMVRPNTRLGHDVTEHAGILLVRSAHALASFKTVRAW